MAFSEELADRVREIVEESAKPVERKMFGGIAWMVGGHMCVGVMGDDLLLRLGDDGAEKALKNANVRPMEFQGKQMKNFLRVAPKATSKEKDLRAWIGKGLDFVTSLPPKEKKKPTKKK